MIKGVNREIIEIADPKNSHFERALLFLRPQASGLTTFDLHRLGSDYVTGLAPQKQQKTDRTLNALYYFLGVFCGMLASLGIVFALYMSGVTL